MTEYIALLMQVQSLLDSGMTEAEVQSLFPELDFSGAMDQIAAIQTFLSDRKNLLPGLESMFSEAIPDEVLKIATDLDMTGAQARWAEFAQNPGDFQHNRSHHQRLRPAGGRGAAQAGNGHYDFRL